MNLIALSARTAARRAALCLALLGGAFASGASASVIVGNGGFDIVDGRAGLPLGQSRGAVLSTLGGTGGGSWSIYDSLPGGWTSPSAAGIEVQSSATLRDGIGAHSGSHYVELDTETENGSLSNSVMEQVLGTLNPGRYALSFWYRSRSGNAASDGIRVEVTNGLDLLTRDIASSVTSWQQQVMSFVVLPGSGDVTLRFSATGTADERGGLLDTVSIAAVPLPGAGLLFLTALGGAAAVYRRRRA